MDQETRAALNPYRGRLTTSQASIGIDRAKANAERLLTDAEHLLQTGGSPSACTLAALAIEETSKPAIIRKLLLATSPEELRRGWKLFSSHQSKAIPWIVPQIVRSRPGTVENFMKAYICHNEPALLDAVKQISIYLGCYGNCHWSQPSEVIEGELTESFIAAARLLIAGGRTSALDTDAGLELWQTHMTGCFSVGYATANNKIIDYIYAAADAGVLDERVIPMEVGFDFITTALMLADGRVEEQAQWLGVDLNNPQARS